MKHDIIKNHKLVLYKYRFDFIKAMKVTENMLHYFKYKVKGINIAEKAKQQIDDQILTIKTVRYQV